MWRRLVAAMRLDGLGSGVARSRVKPDPGARAASDEFPYQEAPSCLQSRQLCQDEKL